MPKRSSLAILPLAVLAACTTPDTPAPFPNGQAPPPPPTQAVAPPPAAAPQLSWDATHDWVTRRWAESTIYLTINGVRHEVGNHPSKESPLTRLTPADYPVFVPPDAFSVIRADSSTGTVYYYAVPDAAPRSLVVFQYRLNDFALPPTPDVTRLATLGY